MNMRKVFYLVLSLVIASCTSNKELQEKLAFIDVTKEYPEKKIELTDIADVSYLYLNSKNDDYLYKGSIDYVTENNIIVIDRSQNSVLFFSKEGNPKSHFNRRGQGPEEYSDAASLMYDEANDEVFVSPDFSNHIMVYSSLGEFKRKINLPQVNVNGQMALFDDVSILVYDNTKLWQSTMQSNAPEVEQTIDSVFFLISKLDGTVLDYILLPNENIDLSYKDLNSVFTGQVSYGRVRKSADGLLLYNPESDTVFHYSKEKHLTPYMHKKPILSSQTSMTVMDICMDEGKYQFIAVYPYRETAKSPTPKYYMRNKATGELFRQKITLSDFEGKELYINPRLLNYYEHAYHFELDFAELEEAYYKNKLSGKLKEQVASLLEDEESNNVFVFADFY